MDDVFYFSHAVVTFEDLMDIAEEFGYQSRVRTHADGEEWLHIYYQADEADWMWIPVSEAQGDFQSFEPVSLKIVTRYNPASAYIVHYRVLSWVKLRVFLRRVMERYGGWVGSDTDGWKPIYTAENIQTQANPLYRKTLADNYRIGKWPA